MIQDITKKDLRAFMRPEAKTEKIIKTPAPANFKDADGKPIMLEIKALHSDSIQKINENYTTKSIATDNKGNPFIQNGEVIFRTETDNKKASQHIIVEALVYPNLKDPELMKYFDCVDVTEMPRKVFPTNEEYKHVNRAVMMALGLVDSPTEEDKNHALEEVKN